MNDEPRDRPDVHKNRPRTEPEKPEKPAQKPNGPNGPPPRHPDDPGPVSFFETTPKRKQRLPYGLLTSAEALDRVKPPDYLVKNLLQRGYTYTLTGRTGHCKTLIALLLAIKVARGDWFCGRKCKPGTVIFFAGENPENVLIQFRSMCADLEIDPKSLDIVWHLGTFDLNERGLAKVKEMLAHYPGLALIIYDSLQAFFAGDDDNKNPQMLDHARSIRSIGAGHSNHPVSIIIAHPAKEAGKEGLQPRGGSALTNELDGNLMAWVDDEKDIVTLSCGKYRGIPFDPVTLERAIIQPPGMVDSDGDQLSCIIVRQIGPIREGELWKQASQHAIRVLKVYADNPKFTQQEVQSATNFSRAIVRRVITGLKNDKLIRQVKYSRLTTLTREGKEVLEQEAKSMNF